mmetsp:Transcript_28476/g.44294  ORF Transcript_28476/g.44294 Transcript_28476/m.44294 type:complete len:373 (-) Transcript_28476:134-1252(-)|eukprot:CAMPEP_0196804576 /NCGR_PEP_ID=MMETSP1362-20130617/4208_1 /TAXON_ID=163516 /ORGANISM="Leptocylindrus danicus, Strain CCMP1856" /LENGTH=372 /DNA_ID=CAMNT_0042176975 /DNA_START=752 /DNA_END=1870 /DNA_ORIENTATION=-
MTPGFLACIAIAIPTLNYYVKFVILVFSTFLIAGFAISDMLFRPSWYAKQRKKRLIKTPPDYDGAWRIDEKRSGLNDPKMDLGLDFENVEFECGPIALPGNKLLRGWFIPPPNAKSSKQQHDLCVVVCHGGGRDRRQHLRHVPTLHNFGAAVLLFDKQEHGLSDGNERGIGWFSYEGSDMYAACRYAKINRQFQRVVSMGTSFGAAGALIASGHFDTAGKHQVIDGVIAENPPHGKYRFLRDVMHLHGAPLFIPYLVREILAIAVYIAVTLRRGSASITALQVPDPLQIMRKIAPRPLLITHGMKDTVVPFEHGLELFEEAMEPKDCLWVPDCVHTQIINYDFAGWERKVLRVLERVMAREGGVVVLDNKQC